MVSPSSFKLIITSRDERVPRSFYDDRACRRIILETGDSVSRETVNDIRIFFEESFDRITPEIGLPSTWPGEVAIDQLTDRAAGLFIWAKTAMAFMEDKFQSQVQGQQIRPYGCLSCCHTQFLVIQFFAGDIVMRSHTKDPPLK